MRKSRSSFRPTGGSAAVELKEHVETLWNSGEYDPAIVEIAGLAALCGGREPQVEAIWRIPETSASPDRWSGDIRIGATVEHAYVVDMAVDPQTGNNFLWDSLCQRIQLRARDIFL